MKVTSMAILNITLKPKCIFVFPKVGVGMESR